MPTIHTAQWADNSLSTIGNHAIGTQPGAGVVLCQVEGWIGWTDETSDFANAGVPNPLGRMCGIRAVSHGTSPGRLTDNMTDPNLLLGSRSMDLSQQPFWSDAPSSTGNWSHFTSVYQFLWRGARYYGGAMDWYVCIDLNLVGTLNPVDVTSGCFRFIWW